MVPTERGCDEALTILGGFTILFARFSRKKTK
jgi:hypothetical protein